MCNAEQIAPAASLKKFCTSALVNLLMLDPGNKLTDDYLIAQCGSSIMVNVHFAVELVKEAGCEPPRYVQPIWEEDMAFHESLAVTIRHQQLHFSSSVTAVGCILFQSLKYQLMCHRSAEGVRL